MSKLNESICAVILAAGTSSRMGTAKQLLPLAGRPMLVHVVEAVLAVSFSEVAAVIGHKAKTIQAEIPVADPRFRWIENKEYLSGQASSLRLSVHVASKHNSGIMVFLGDLPFISRKTILEIYEKGSSMLAEYKEPFVIQPLYEEVSGHPVFFGHPDRNLFSRLEGDKGAKAIMKQILVRRQIKVKDIGILLDIDTPDVYEKAIKKSLPR